MNLFRRKILTLLKNKPKLDLYEIQKELKEKDIIKIKKNLNILVQENKVGTGLEKYEFGFRRIYVNFDFGDD